MLLQRALTGVVDFCRRFAVWVVLAGGALAGASGIHASRHLGIDTDTDHMFAASLPWRSTRWPWTTIPAIPGPAGRGDQRKHVEGPDDRPFRAPGPDAETGVGVGRGGHTGSHAAAAHHNADGGLRSDTTRPTSAIRSGPPAAIHQKMGVRLGVQI
jgi:hypothetical protein